MCVVSAREHVPTAAAGRPGAVSPQFRASVQAACPSRRGRCRRRSPRSRSRRGVVLRRRPLPDRPAADRCPLPRHDLRHTEGSVPPVPTSHPGRAPPCGRRVARRSGSHTVRSGLGKAPKLQTKQASAGWVSITAPAGDNGITEVTLTTSGYIADGQPRTASEAVQRHTRTVVQGVIGSSERNRERAPIQLVTPEVAARLAGASLPEVLRWHSAGTGPRAYRVFGYWVFRAREVDQFIRARGRASTAGRSARPTAQTTGGDISARPGATWPDPHAESSLHESDPSHRHGARP
jgi:hypothetical protein